MKPVLLLLPLSVACHALPFVTVKAGPHDRIQTPVTVSLPEKLPENPALKGADGASLPLQISDDGKAMFILPELAAGESARFELVALPEAPADQAFAEEMDGNFRFSVSRKAVASFIGTGRELPRKDIKPVFLRGGYLHPLRSPAGLMVTDDYPAKHLHHHGVWTAWTKAVFKGRPTDFWNMGDGKGKVDCVSADYFWSGPVHAGVEAENAFTDLTSGDPVPALSELWLVRIFAIPEGGQPYRLIEVTSTQTMADDSDLELPEYHYGGFGIRGNGAWDGAGNAAFLTSGGVTDRDGANGKPARWIAMSGETGNGKATIAILGSPENFRAPQPLRVHPTEPFVCFAPQVAGAMTISHDTAYRSRYHLVVTDGEPDKTLLDRLWNDCAEPPVAEWE